MSTSDFDAQPVGSPEPPAESPDLSIVVPAYNEARRLPALFPRFEKLCAVHQGSIELIVVDDGSSDASIEVLERCRQQYGLEGMRVLRNEVNRGKGYTVRRGMLAARGRSCLFTDADLSTPLTELEKLQDRLGGAEVVIASRALSDSVLIEKQRIYRQLGGKGINLFVQALALPGIRDSQCGFKLFTREAARQIFSRVTLDGFSFDIEALFIARYLGYRIAEVPVQWKNAPGSKVDPLRDGLRLIRDLLVIRVNAYRGLYEPVSTRD